MSAVFASQMQSVFAALVYILPIISAVISDQWAGRWIMAISSYAGYVPGGLVLTLGCYYKIDWLSLLSYYLLFAIPASFIKPNLVTLGADQFDARDTEQLRQRGNFFGAQYWMTNVAAAIAFLVMSDLAVSGLGAISKDFGFTFTFIVGTVCLAIGFCVLMSGVKVLYAKSPSGSPLSFFCRVTIDAVKGKLNGKTNGAGIGCLVGLIGLFVSVLCAIITYFVEEPALNYTIAAVIIVCLIMLVWFGQDASWVLQAGKKKPGVYTDEELDGVRCVYALCPYVGFAIPFWAVYNQMYTSFISQGCQMNNVIGGTSFAPSSIGGYNGVVIVIMIPFAEYVIYPLSRKCLRGKLTLTPLRRIGVGFVLAAISMLTAGLVEIWRRSSPLLKVECTDELVDMGFCDVSQIGDPVNDLSSCYSYTGDNASPPAP